MEGELWPEVYRLLMEEGKKRPRPQGTRFSDRRILEIYLWAAAHDRPTSWACEAKNWPADQRWKDLPSQSTMSDRPRTLGVRLFMQCLLDRFRQSGQMSARSASWIPSRCAWDATARIATPIGARRLRPRCGVTRSSAAGARALCPTRGRWGR